MHIDLFLFDMIGLIVSGKIAYELVSWTDETAYQYTRLALSFIFYFIFSYVISPEKRIRNRPCNVNRLIVPD